MSEDRYQDRNPNRRDAAARLRQEGVVRRDLARTGSRSRNGGGGERRFGSYRSGAHGSVLETEPISRRMIVLGALGLGMGAGLLRLGHYQVFGDDRAENELYWRRMYNKTLYAKRGTVYDRNGNVLTSSEDCYKIAVNPSQVTDKSAVVDALVEVLGADEDTCKDAVNGSSYTYIAWKADTEDGDALSAKGLSGIVLEPAMRRVYPFQSAASQVLGVADVDHVGISGLELQYNDILTGENGSIVREQAADSSYIAGGAYQKVPATDGTDMVLTLDIDIQQCAEEALKEAVESSSATYGSILVTNPRTGEILAACSYPTYDPSDLSTARTEDMNLRVVTDAYEPGSVFKPLVCGMSIELGLADADTTYDVPASVKAGDDDVTDSDARDYAMTMTMREILRRSSNTGMILVGEQIGADDFASYIKKYQVGKKSGVDFPGESTGSVKSRDEYDGASVAAMSFGQSLSVSPIEMARAMSAIANKGVMTTPHFLKSIKGEEKDWTGKNKRVLSEETAAMVADMMKTVVDEGTGTGGQVAGYEVSGKTGTAQRASEEGGYQKNIYMASFMGFAPTKDPQVLVYVTLDGTPNLSYAAAPPFATVMTQALTTLGVKPTD